PPHKPYNYTITLQDRGTSCFGPIYSLTWNEFQLLKDLKEWNLSKVFIISNIGNELPGICSIDKSVRSE
ncbi:hypothetical protein K440DRAFT_548753, partial [Wilcoxina mikolae CBS 423.85]